MKKIGFFTLLIYFVSLTFVRAAEGHSHELPGFLHFMEELIEEHSVLRGATFGFIHTLIPLIGFYTGWSINRFGYLGADDNPVCSKLSIPTLSPNLISSGR